jgi:hypothetical protein
MVSPLGPTERPLSHTNAAGASLKTPAYIVFFQQIKNNIFYFQTPLNKLLCFKAENTTAFCRDPAVYPPALCLWAGNAGYPSYAIFHFIFFFFLVAGKILYTHAFFTIFGLIHTILCDKLTDQSMRSANYGLFKTRAADRDPSEVDAGQ